MVALGLAGLAIGASLLDTGALILIGLEGFLRSGEPFGLTSDDVALMKGVLFFAFDSPKSASGKGVYEPVMIAPGIGVERLKELVKIVPKSGLPIRRPPRLARKTLLSLIATAKLSGYGFNWYSLRRGSATHLSSIFVRIVFRFLCRGASAPPVR